MLRLIEIGLKTPDQSVIFADCVHVCIVTGSHRPLRRSARFQYTYTSDRELYCSCISYYTGCCMKKWN